jgi:hypothetical protein
MKCENVTSQSPLVMETSSPSRLSSLTSSTPSPSSSSERIRSLDQFRGLAVLLGLLINWWCDYFKEREGTMLFCHTHTYLSLADLVMPLFYCAVGFAYRLTFLRALEKAGGDVSSVRSGVWVRARNLLIFSFFLYGVWGGSWTSAADWFEQRRYRSILRNYFETLSLIPLCQLLLLPFIHSSPVVLLAYVCSMSVIYSVLSYLFYFRIAWDIPVIDGGGLGVMSWCLCMAVGAMMHDWRLSEQEGWDNQQQDTLITLEEGHSLTLLLFVG